MCKDCRYYSANFTKEQLREDLERHRRRKGYSGYPGAKTVFLNSIDDKETISAIISAAERHGYDDMVKLGNQYKNELQQLVWDILDLNKFYS